MTRHFLPHMECAGLTALSLRGGSTPRCGGRNEPPPKRRPRQRQAAAPKSGVKPPHSIKYRVQFRRSSYSALSLTCLVLACLILAAPAATIDRSAYSETHGFDLQSRGEGLRLEWPSSDGTAFIDLEFRDPEKRRDTRPLVNAIGINGSPVMTGLEPQYFLWVGERTLQEPNKWTIFFDKVPTRPHSVEKAVLNPSSVRIESTPGRATIEIGELKSSTFYGTLAFKIYRGSAFVQMEARVSTDRDATAYLYHAGLTKADTADHRLQYLDTHGQRHDRPVNEAFPATALRTKFRSLALSSERGSLALAPFPHQFLYPLDFAENFGYNWAGRDYLDMTPSFGFGIRQPPQGDRRFVPWVNAPPGTVQKLSVLLFPSAKKGFDSLEIARRYTRGDRFKALPGFKTMTSHYHIEHSLDFLERQREQNTSGIPEGLEKPEFVEVFKDMGIDIVHLAEFHRGATPRLRTAERLAQLDVMHRECERLSTDDFLLIPGEEPNVHLGGHWISLFPKPVEWVLNRPKNQPFVQAGKDGAPLYHVGSKAEVLDLFEREGGLMWTAHPRIKSSTGYPDKYRDEEFYRSDRFLGAAWKAMPADYSRDTLGWRVLDLLDEMANWGGNNKFALGEVDIFKLNRGYELYGAVNINYLALDAIPKYRDGWQPVLDSLRAGTFFVTTGEILIPSFAIAGKESGETLALGRAKTSRARLRAELEWTFPLSHAVLVSGDGKKIFRERIDLSDTGEFGSLTLEHTVNLFDRTWARLEVWDIAVNGAFTQPVWIE